jgi:hypothetical protein
MHQMCHQYNRQRGFRDTSDDGIYHNRRFKETAEKRGLAVASDPKFGYSTSPTPELTKLVQENCRANFSMGKEKNKAENIKIYEDNIRRENEERRLRQQQWAAVERQKQEQRRIQEAAERKRESERRQREQLQNREEVPEVGQSPTP